MSEAILIQKLKNYDAFYPSGGIQVIPPPPEPTIGTMPQILDYGEVPIETTVIKSYNLSIENLIPSSGNITVTAPAGFAISLSEYSGYASILTIPYTEGHLIYGKISTLVYVRFSPTSVQNYDNVIVHSGGGALDQNIILLGDGIEPIPEDLEIVGVPFAAVDVTGLKTFVWGTNYPSTSKVWWGLAANALTNTFATNTNLVTYHRLDEFIGLIDTTIFYKVVSTTPAGAYVESSVYYFNVSNLVAYGFTIPNPEFTTSLKEIDHNVNENIELGISMEVEEATGINIVPMEVDYAGTIDSVDQNSAQEAGVNDEYTGFVRVTGATEKTITISGNYSDSVTRVYKIEIDGVGTPNTFKWSDDNGATWQATGVNCDVVPIVLNHGVSIAFTVTIGHAVGQFWTFNRKP